MILAAVTIWFYGVGSVGLFTASFSHLALCHLWAQGNATEIHRAVVIEECHE